MRRTLSMPYGHDTFLAQGLDIIVRRLILIAGFWLGFLGVAQPLLACTMQPSRLNCCPAGVQVPCGPESPSQARSNCCTSAPATGPTLAAMDAREVQPPGHGPGNLPASAIHNQWWAAPDTSIRVKRVSLTLPARAGTETYLLTLRLRL